MQKFIISICLVGMLVGCTYKMEIQQGNIISEEQLALVETGMDTKQVRFILGTPLLADPFHANRWDYYYSLKQQGELVEQYRVTLYFEQDRLVRMDKQGKLPPTEHPGDAPAVD